MLTCYTSGHVCERCRRILSESRLLKRLCCFGLRVAVTIDAIRIVHAIDGWCDFIEEGELLLLVAELIVDEVGQIERDLGRRELFEIILGVLLYDLLDLLLLLEKLLWMLLNLFLENCVAIGEADVIVLEILIYRDRVVVVVGRIDGSVAV